MLDIVFVTSTDNFTGRYRCPYYFLNQLNVFVHHKYLLIHLPEKIKESHVWDFMPTLLACDV